MSITQAKRICITSSPRTGSTFLFDVIDTYSKNDHPHNTKRRYDYCEPVRESHFNGDYDDLMKNMDEVERWTTKIHYFDIELIKKNIGWEKFRDQCDYHILLYRKNLYQSSLSLAISWQKDQWINNMDNQSIELDQKIYRQSIHNQWRNINITRPRGELGVDYNMILTQEDDLFPSASKTWSHLTGIEKTKLNEYQTRIQPSPPKEQIILNAQQIRNVWLDTIDKLDPITGVKLVGEEIVFE